MLVNQASQFTVELGQRGGVGSVGEWASLQAQAHDCKQYLSSCSSESENKAQALETFIFCGCRIRSKQRVKKNTYRFNLTV